MSRCARHVLLSLSFITSLLVAAAYPVPMSGRSTCAVHRDKTAKHWISNCSDGLLCCNPVLAPESNLPNAGVCYNPFAGEACCVSGTTPPVIFHESPHLACCGNLSWGAPEVPSLYDPSKQFCCGFWPAGPNSNVFQVTTTCSIAPKVNNSARCCGSGDAMKFAFCCSPTSTCYNPFYPFGSEDPSVCCDTESEFGCGYEPPVCCKRGEICCQYSGCCPGDKVCCTVGAGCCPSDRPDCCGGNRTMSLV